MASASGKGCSCWYVAVYPLIPLNFIFSRHIVGAYDTKPDEALKITWKPFPVGKSVCFNSLQDQYLRSLTDAFQSSMTLTDKIEYDPSLPMEHYLEFELSNPHSRAKKQARWQAKKQAVKDLKEEYVTKELERAKQTGVGKPLGGRRVKPSEAKRIGEWKWKLEVAKMEKGERVRRFIAKGGLENEKKRQVRSVRKVRRQQEKLRNLVIGEAKNQVLPPSMKQAKA